MPLIRRTDLVGFNRLNPQLQERVIKTKIDRRKWDRHDRWDRDRHCCRRCPQGAIQ